MPATQMPLAGHGKHAPSVSVALSTRLICSRSAPEPLIWCIAAAAVLLVALWLS
jgi:hypothetical protein